MAQCVKGERRARFSMRGAFSVLSFWFLVLDSWFSSWIEERHPARKIGATLFDVPTVSWREGLDSVRSGAPEEDEVFHRHENFNARAAHKGLSGETDCGTKPRYPSPHFFVSADSKGFNYSVSLLE